MNKSYAPSIEITQEYLKSILHYDPETGIFTWLKSYHSHRIGKIAGSLDRQGYWNIHIDYKKIRYHRLAFLYMTGKWPKEQVDHINRIRNDNRWCNLREVTKLQNRMNCSFQRDSTSGYKGVSWNNFHQKWMSYININKKKVHLGYFSTKEEAARAYNKVAIKYYGEFAFLNDISKGGSY